MSRSTSSSSSVRPIWTAAPNCLHGLPMNILTSQTALNCGRRFFCCSVRKWDDCDFFQWLDSLSPSTFCRNNCERRLQIQREIYEEQLELLTEKLRVKEMEFEVLAAELEHAVGEAKEWKKSALDVMKKIGIAVFLIVVLAKIGFF